MKTGCAIARGSSRLWLTVHSLVRDLADRAVDLDVLGQMAWGDPEADRCVKLYRFFSDFIRCAISLSFFLAGATKGDFR